MTSTPDEMRLFAAAVSFCGEYHAFVHSNLTLAPGCVACAPSVNALACRTTSGMPNGTT